MINISFWNILFTVINLLLLFIVVRIFFFKPIKKILEQRQAEADEIFNKATEEEHAAEEHMHEYEEKLVSAEAEKKQIIADARHNADVEYQNIVDSAKAEAKQIKKDAIANAENKKEEILNSAKKEITDMVIEATGKVVGSKSGADVDSELFDQFLGKAGE